MIRFAALHRNQKTVIFGVSVGTSLCHFSGCTGTYYYQNSNDFQSTCKTNLRRYRQFHSTKTICEPKTPGTETLKKNILPSRSEQVSKLVSSSKQEFDVLIVGGGATGCGAALDATTRGLSTACIDRGDFGNETSARSTKLLWVS